MIIPKKAPNSSLTIGSNKGVIYVHLNRTNEGRAPGYMMMRGSLVSGGYHTTRVPTNVCESRYNISQSFPHPPSIVVTK